MMIKEMIFTALIAAGLAGCASPEPIHFESEVPAAVLEKQTMPPAAPAQSLQPLELRQIEAAVYAWLLQHSLPDEPVYSAIFLRADESLVQAMMDQFPGHKPPVKPPWHLQLRPSQSPLDKDTGQPALVYSVDISEPEQDSVSAVGRWWSGEAFSGYRVFQLQKTSLGWQIQTVQ